MNNRILCAVVASFVFACASAARAADHVPPAKSVGGVRKPVGAGPDGTKLKATVNLAFANDAKFAPSAAQKATRYPSSTVIIRGRITPSRARYFLSLAKAGKVRQVVVNSPGGDERSSMLIGAEIARLNVPLVVNQLCASGCASYIFLFAKKRRIEPGSLVIFHNTASALLAMLPERVRDHQIAKKFLETDHLARKSFRVRGLSLRLLFRPQLAIHTICYKLTPLAPNKKAQMSFASTYAGWIPDRKFLERNGVKFTGFWPNTISQIKSSVTKLRGRLHGKIRIGGGDDPVSAAALYNQLRKIRSCDKVNPKLSSEIVEQASHFH